MAQGFTRRKGQQTAANSDPVVIASDQTVPINGSVSLLGTSAISGSVTAIQGTLPWTVAPSGAFAISAASLPLPTGAATDANNNTLVGSPGTSPPALASSASGILGWLRKIVDTLTGGVPISGTTAISGNVVSSHSDTRPTSQNITAQDSGSSTVTGQNGASIVTGSPTANSTASQTINGVAAFRLQISGTWSATLQIEMSVDGGTTWIPTTVVTQGTNYYTSSITGNGSFIGNCSGATNIRVRCTAFTSGTVVAQFAFAIEPSVTKVHGPVAVIDNSSGNQAVVSSAGALAIAGDVASGSSDNGAPIKQGFQARTTNPSAVSDAQRVNGIADKVGRQAIIVGHIREQCGVQTTTITSSSETTIVTAVTSTYCDLSSIILTNTSSTNIYVSIRDTTGGSVVLTLCVPANDTRGFTSAIPLKQSSVNTNWTATASTGVSSLLVTATYIKNI